MTPLRCKTPGITAHCDSCKYGPRNAPKGEPMGRPMTPNAKAGQCRSYVKLLTYGVRK